MSRNLDGFATRAVPQQGDYMPAFEAEFGGLCPEHCYERASDGCYYSHGPLQLMFIGWYLGTRAYVRDAALQDQEKVYLVLPARPTPALLATFLMLNATTMAEAASNYEDWFLDSLQRAESLRFDRDFQEFFGQPARASVFDQYVGQTLLVHKGWQMARAESPDVIEMAISDKALQDEFFGTGSWCELIVRTLRHQAPRLRKQGAPSTRRLRMEPSNTVIPDGKSGDQPLAGAVTAL